MKITRVFVALFVVTLAACSQDEDAATSPPPAAAPSESVATSEPASAIETSPSRPNILLIVADDVGYADLGAYGSEIETPNLDALARAGTQFTNFHVAPTCSPTRSMLFSGTDNHLAGVGNMFEVMRTTNSALLGSAGYEGYLNFRVASLANLMGDAGYHTYMAGKWHLGLTEETSPAARGFDNSFVLVDGGASHFTDMGLEVKQPKGTYREDGKVVPLPENFYSTRTYTDKLLGYLQQERSQDEPFFAYLAFTAPHWPLMAPAASHAKYVGKYDEGYDVLLQQRLAKMRALGLVSADAPIPPRQASEVPWEELGEEQQKREARSMELFAAMLDDLDKHVGRVIEHLKSTGEFDNTFILFMSDNGPEGERLDEFPAFGEFINQCCDLSYENMGKPGSYVFYGPNWARAGAGHLRAYKGFPSEGGIRVPAFVHYPGFDKQAWRTDSFVSVMDVLPTFLELAGTEHPGTAYQGREVHPIKGKSMLPMLQGAKDRVHDDNFVMGWELFGHTAIRQGDRKLLRMKPPFGTGDWQLYDVAQDPTEQNDLSDEAPEDRARLLRLWDEYAKQGNITLRDFSAE